MNRIESVQNFASLFNFTKTLVGVVAFTATLPPPAPVEAVADFESLKTALLNDLLQHRRKWKWFLAPSFPHQVSTSLVCETPSDRP